MGPYRYYLDTSGDTLGGDDLCELLRLARDVDERLEVHRFDGVLLAWRNARGASTYDRGAS